MARKPKHPELQGRSRHEVITNIKKGSSMPAAKKGEKLKPFYVAEGVKMGRPNEGLTQKDPRDKRIATYGDQVMLSKAQAEWCMANGFIDSILPDFEPDNEPELDFSTPKSVAEESSEPASEGAGKSDVRGASDEDSVQGAPARKPRRAAATL